jgi:hypothetical protein
MSAASNQFRLDVAKLLATTNVHELADVLMEVAGRLIELRVTVAQSDSVGTNEMLMRMARAESDIERSARLLSFNA